jgi:hypothetical protein
MPTKNYKITINTDKEFDRFQNEEAIKYLLNNLGKIENNSISVLADDVDWEEQAQTVADDIWYEQNLDDRINEVSFSELSLEYAEGWFNDTDTALQCLKQLGDYEEINDIDTEDLNTYWQILQRRATYAFAGLIDEKLNDKPEIDCTMPF